MHHSQEAPQPAEPSQPAESSQPAEPAAPPQQKEPAAPPQQKEPLTWAERLLLQDSSSQASSKARPPKLMPRVIRENSFEDWLRREIFEKLTKKSPVVLYFHNVIGGDGIGGSLHQVLSGLCEKYDNIEITLPKVGSRASITIQYGVENDAVKELIKQLAETEFTTKDGIRGCCYTETRGARDEYALPKQRADSSFSSEHGSTIECTSNGRTNARALNNRLNSKLG